MEENKNGESERRLTSAERRALYQQRADEKNAAAALRKNRKKVIIASAAICGALLLAIAAVLLALHIKNTVIPSNKYDDASALFDAGEYQKAYDIFSELGDFSDSRSKYKECIDNIRNQELLKAISEKGSHDIDDYSSIISRLSHDDYIFLAYSIKIADTTNIYDSAKEFAVISVLGI